jgi:hypothetical protein
MIDNVFQTVKTIVNKELAGNLTPTELNKLAKLAQDEIFASYFEDINLLKNKQNRGLTNLNNANLPQKVRQKIDIFSTTAIMTDNSGLYTLPTDLYFVEDRGIIYGNDTVVDEAQKSELSFLNSSIAAPSTTFPVYERLGNDIKIYPSTITDPITVRYIRRPLTPRWTYTEVFSKELFNPSAVDYQDFELHVSEFDNLVLKMLSYAGINLREGEVALYAENKMNQENIKQGK